MNHVGAAVVVVAAIVVVGAAAAGCPERKEAVIEQVGGAPKTEIDTAKARLNASSEKMRQQAHEAAQATE